MFVCALHGVSPQAVRLAEMASEREPWMAKMVEIRRMANVRAREKQFRQAEALDFPSCPGQPQACCRVKCW